ncbi:MAG TPA: hypothetical protein VKD72_39960, partial [Gemmataceae bacterium]|nr:hypothetical protein [Gemmataceae bacterium]
MSHSPSQKTVDTSAICAWLGVPPDLWPPDHYTLLGLPPGESSAERIEQHVQQRIECVRRYQLTNPEAATEAMNRLAQAFVCLTDAQARRAYDRSLFGTPPPAATETPRNGIPALSPSSSPPAVPLQEMQPSFRRDTDTTTAYQPTLLDLSPLETPEQPLESPAVPAPTAEEEVGDPELLALVEEEVRAEERRAAALAQSAAPAAALPAVPEAPVEPAEPPDPFVEAARSSEPARRGLGTKRALYYRIARTRALLRVWDQAGKYLNQPTRRLTRPA